MKNEKKIETRFVFKWKDEFYFRHTNSATQQELFLILAIGVYYGTTVILSWCKKFLKTAILVLTFHKPISKKNSLFKNLAYKQNINNYYMQSKNVNESARSLVVGDLCSETNGSRCHKKLRLPSPNSPVN